MIKNLLLFTLLSLVPNLIVAQTNLLTEDFETDGEGTRYTSNAFDAACHDYFKRYENVGDNCLTNEPTNASGTFYWAGEDLDLASGGQGILTLNSLTVTGYTLEMQVYIAIGRPNDFRFEPADELLFQYNMDGGGWNTFGALYGTNDGTPGNMGNLIEDADLDGSYDPGGTEITSSNFTDWTFSIPVTGNSLEVRVIMKVNHSTEEMVIDNIRINSVAPMPVDLTGFNLLVPEEGEVQVNWETASEIDNDYFLVERSRNAVEWEIVKKIDGVGNSDELTRYSLVDRGPLLGTSYYRVKQVDLNGSYSHSEIKQISIIKNEDHDVLIYPNPSIKELIIEGEKSELKELQVLNSMGQNVINLIASDQVSDTQLKMNVSRLSSGIYFVKTKNTINKIQVVNMN